MILFCYIVPISAVLPKEVEHYLMSLRLAQRTSTNNNNVDGINNNNVYCYCLFHLLTLHNYMTLRMTSASKVVETLVNVILNSPSQDYSV